MNKKLARDVYLRSISNLKLILTALNECEDILSKNNNDAQISDSFIDLGYRFLELRSVAESLLCFEKSLDYNPKNKKIRLKIVKVLLDSHDFRKAEVKLNKMDFEERDNDVNWLKAKLYYYLENYDKSCGYLKYIIDGNEIKKKSLAYQLLATILDKKNKYVEAYEYFLKANEIDLSSINSEQKNTHDLVRRHTLELKNLSKNYTHQQKVKDNVYSPVFLVGFSRSGTTLLGQILNSHSKISTHDEYNIFNTMMKDALGKYKHPNEIMKMSVEKCLELSDDYKREHGLNSEKDWLVVDKNPFIIRHLLFIKQVFPNAKIIVAIRHPLDVILSNFMQSFSLNDMTRHFFTIKSTALIYKEIMELYLMYKESLGLNILEIYYEDLVSNVEIEAKKTCEFLGFEWEKDMLAYNVKAKDVLIMTPSNEQVVKPIYNSSVYRYKNYLLFMEAICPMVEDILIKFGYTIEGNGKEV